MPIEVPPKLWVPQKPAIIRAAPGDDRRLERLLRLAGTFPGFPLPGLAVAAGATYTTWNPSDKSASMTLSNGNLTATAASTIQGVRSASSKSTGKWYVELNLDNLQDQDDPIIGLAKAGESFTTNPITGTNSWTVRKNGSAGTGINKRFNSTNTLLTTTNTLAVNDKLLIAWDADAGKLWFGRNGAWYNPDGNPGVGDPVAGTNPVFTSVTGTLFVFFQEIRSAFGVTANFGTSAFAYTIPSGFSGWTV